MLTHYGHPERGVGGGGGGFWASFFLVPVWLMVFWEGRGWLLPDSDEHRQKSGQALHHLGEGGSPSRTRVCSVQPSGEGRDPLGRGESERGGQFCARRQLNLTTRHYETKRLGTQFIQERTSAPQEEKQALASPDNRSRSHGPLPSGMGSSQQISPGATLPSTFF